MQGPFTATLSSKFAPQSDSTVTTTLRTEIKDAKGKVVTAVQAEVNTATQAGGEAIGREALKHMASKGFNLVPGTPFPLADEAAVNKLTDAALGSNGGISHHLRDLKAKAGKK